MSIEQRLQAPFAPADIEWRVQREVRNGEAVMVIPYVTNRAIQHRLDEVFGAFGWENRFLPGANGGILCELRIRNPETGEWVTKQDGAENTQVEAVKGGMSSAMKRTAVQLGIGRYLYYLDFQYMPLKDRGHNYHRSKGTGRTMYWDTPSLPAWALPKERQKNAS
jgi:hypothetical protein